MSIHKKLLLTSLCTVLISSSAIAKPYSDAFNTIYDNLRVRGLINFQYISEENDDLGTQNENREDSLATQARIMLNYKFTDTVDGYLDVRGYRIKGDSGAEDDTGNIIFNQDFFEIRQYWLRQKNLFGYLPLSLQIGRHRITEPRTIWWNKDLDAARLIFDKTLTKGFVGVGENLVAYRTNGSDFEEDDKSRFRFFGEVSHQYKYNHFLDARFMYEHDHSDNERVGQLLDAEDHDLEDANLLWLGTRQWGKFKDVTSIMPALHYRLDVMGVYGSEERRTTTSGPSVSLRRVTSVEDFDVFGWGLDAGFEADFNIPLSPVFKIGYAYGSGDSDTTDKDDGAFRQTGIHGNSSRRRGDIKAIRNYGEIFRPELSNLHILSTGLKLPAMDASALHMNYYSYWLDEKNAPLRSAGITGALTGQDTHIGQALDFTFNSELLSEYNVKSDYVKKTYLKLIAGTFKSGDAYAPAGDDETAFRFLAELEFRF
ncbi:MAG: alginate export family protein [Alphaproteobacteria bacterium]|nr:alginate export family protein [Alphaproteobacteria bacterium]